MPMQIPKPSPADRERFVALIPSGPGIEVKPMFGNLGAFVNGNMFAGLFGAAIGLKLADPDRSDLAALGGGPFGPAERPMGGYLTIPDAVLADPGAASDFVSRAIKHVAALPAKDKAPRKPPKRA